MIIVLDIFFKRFRGITLFPFIILKKKEYLYDKVLINHEKIHLRQQLEMLIVFFYLWYVIEYVYESFKYGGGAYRKNSFEMEAYENQYNLDYLKNRKWYSWVKYL